MFPISCCVPPCVLRLEDPPPGNVWLSLESVQTTLTEMLERRIHSICSLVDRCPLMMESGELLRGSDILFYNLDMTLSRILLEVLFVE